MRKNPVPAGQLSWLALVEQEERQPDDGEDLSYTDRDFVPNAQYPHMPEYVVKQERWADGDESPADLEHLVEVLLDIGVETFKDSRGDVYKYVAITTAVIGTKVWCAYQFERKLARYVPHGKDDDIE